MAGFPKHLLDDRFRRVFEACPHSLVFRFRARRRWLILRFEISDDIFRRADNPPRFIKAIEIPRRVNRRFFGLAFPDLDPDHLRMRDSILAITGELNTEMYGPGVYLRIAPDIINTGSRPRWPLDAKDEHATFRRSVYIFVKRSVLVPMLEVFDCPVTVVPSPVRSTSTVSPQALALMNNQFVLEQAGYLAERLIKEAGAQPRAQIRRGFQLAPGRLPSVKETQWALDFLKAQTAGYAERNNEKTAARALRDFCHALINLNEFVYVD